MSRLRKSMYCIVLRRIFVSELLLTDLIVLSLMDETDTSYDLFSPSLFLVLLFLCFS